MENPKVSVIIVTYDNWLMSKQCFDFLQFCTEKVSKEIVVVDNGSPPEMIEELKKYPGIRFLRNDHGKTHFAQGCNKGAFFAVGKYFLFLNNDTLFTDDFITPMIANMDDPKVGIVGAKCIYLNGTIQHAGVGFKKNGSPRHVYKNWPEDAPDVNFKKEFQSVTAACMLVRREAYYQVNGFDEIFKTGKEDVDFCLKVGQAGWKIIYEPKARIIHFEHKSPGRHDFDEYNRAIYLQRWGGKVREDISVIKALGNVVK